MNTQLIVAFISLVFFASVANAQKAVWEPVPQSEIQMSGPQVDPAADAEVLFWQVYLVDNFSRWKWQTVINHHLRIKIFTERGRELNAKVDIPYGDYLGNSARVAIRDISARTIKPDGSVIEVNPADIFDRDIVKTNGFKRKAKSFAVPGIAVGAIVEYKWKETREDTFNYSRIVLAREIPVQYVKYYIKPANIPLGMRLHSSNTNGRFVKESDGFYSTTLTNVPAVLEEPRMPSEYNVLPWVLMFYDNDDIKQTPAQYWRDRGRRSFESHKAILSPNSEIRAAAAQAIGNANDSNEKIRRVIDFLRRNIRDINDDAAGFTPDDRENFKENKKVEDALKRKVGTWHDISLLFGSMLVSIGFDARFANVATKFDARFDRNLTNDYFIRTEIVAVKTESGWKFFDLSGRHLQFGMISSSVEGESVLISDEREPFWETIPVSPANDSNEKRFADLTLEANGDISGSIQIEYTGHLAAYYREFYDEDSVQEREKYFEEFVKRQIGDTAQTTNMIFENLREPDRPLILKFMLKMPAYAERTGKRLFVRPNVFKRNSRPMFTSAKRSYDIQFNYAWSEDDEVRLTIPAGFAAESLETPKRVADDKSAAFLESKLSSPGARRLVYQRKFTFGKPGGLLFWDFNYGGIKYLFDAVHNADSFSVVLREEASAVQ
ncbi:MAG: DUF3857 and transglutaminase domain-containing protein [Acidobacteria bacterium]|nr:DUF3857 and transglutaminase domain-containing protein [Acidobacteriota bacterium]